MVRIVFALITLVVFVSCQSNSKEELTVYRMAHEGLVQSNQSLSANNDIIYKALDQRLSDPSYMESAKAWQPKALLIKDKSEVIVSYLDSLILELKKSSDLKLVNNVEIFDELNLGAVQKHFIDNDGAKKLIAKLYQYKKDVLAIDPELNEIFGKKIIVVSRRYQTIESEDKNAEVNLFKHIPVIAAIVLLKRFENNIRNIESNTIQFCLNKIPSTDGHGFDVYRTLIGQSSTIVQGGESIKIQAGVGAFSASPNPSVFIDGKVLKTENGNGYVEYSFKAPIKPGHYTKNVTIEFTKEDGAKQKVTNIIEYTVKD